MTGAELLEKCRDGVDDLNRLEARIQRLKVIATEGNSAWEDKIEAQAELETRVERLDAERTAACRMCDMMPEPECTVVYRYFVLGQSQGQITMAMHLSNGYYKKKKKAGMEIAGLVSEDSVKKLLPDWYEE